MAQDSGIEWTDATWNCLAGCSIVSPGCHSCYAMKQAHRFNGLHPKYEGTTKLVEGHGPRWTGKVNLDEEALQIPLKWKKPRRIFVNSMSDLFHENVPDEFIWKVFRTMRLAHWHTFQVLTKRADRMEKLMRARTNEHAILTIEDKDFNVVWPLPNVWLGVSVEDQSRADERIPHLLQTPAAVRFLSVEPLLGPIVFDNGWSVRGKPWVENGVPPGISEGIDWVICGGESGHGARPCDISWIRSIVEQCQDAAVPVFVKQLGSHAVDRLDLSDPSRTNFDMDFADSKGGDMSEWPEDLRVRLFPEVPHGR